MYEYIMVYTSVREGVRLSLCTYNIASYIQSADAQANICKEYRACRCTCTNNTALHCTRTHRTHPCS